MVEYFVVTGLLIQMGILAFVGKDYLWAKV
jgi:hypothetical protein